MTNSIYTYKNLSLSTVFIITALFFGVGFIGIYFHEIWMDESHHFLLGRDSNSLQDLYNNTRYDGRPIFWNYLIHLITKFSYNPFYIQLLHITITCIIAFIFLKKQGFYLWNKDCLPLFTMSSKELITEVFKQKPSKKTLYFILNMPINIDEFQKNGNKKHTISLTKKFEGAVKHNYYMYLIKRYEQK
ncbi:hypothetical protein [Polaribacter porphyrae]|uniref:Uncharacterized protein n=1 Tax=Polaribacter porphyrae TaxID=1137780 RepID=A0A2S7WPZ6_9FLAO|nr:hypothetical protein [Polaribacter porphyrae]PQJ79351.1 hypothetical protein BTO18_09265 [Polaribacter porphyrae]